MSTSFTRGENPLRADKLNTAFNERVSRDGDTMLGMLALAGDPSLAMQAATKQYVDTKIAGIPPGGGGGSGGSPVAITQTVVTLTANSDTTLISANVSRKSLSLITTGSGDVTLNFGAAASIGQGWPLPAATASEKTGKAMSWEISPPIGSVHGIAASNTTVVVLEGI